MRVLLWAAPIALILLLSIDAAACTSDSDCPGSTYCVRLFGELEGLCEKGVTNWDAKKPVAPANKNTTEGKRCEVDADCDAYMSCVAQPNLKYRVCRRN
jgi:hypothetical protein